MLKPLRKLFRNNQRKRIASSLRSMAPSLLEMELHQLKQAMAAEMPDNPALRGFKAFSQNEEDGIIQDILSRIPVAARTNSFIEIGCGNGLENNTHYLAVKGNRGYWVDGSATHIAQIERHVRPGNPVLKVTCKFIGVHNIADVIADAVQFLGTKEVDFFSLDIDGNDLHVLKQALNHMRPKVLCVEYNAKFPPPFAAAMRYDAAHCWRGGDYHGASLQAFVDLLTDYQLVCCDLAGVNAFFVHNSYANAFARYPIEKLYQKARYRFAQLPCGHAGTFRWLEQVLQTRQSS